MTQIIHYFVLLFIVFVCAEIRNVLLYDIPYQNTPVNIWNESPQNVQPVTGTVIKFM